MARAWLIDGRGIATKVKNACLPTSHQIKDCGAQLVCPNCQYGIDNSDVSYEWPGLPLGVKFDPSDAELVDHLAAKCGLGDSKPHKFIDEFIPTLEGDEGICYTHPENLPGAKKDGNSIHFFYKIANAYASGSRKRRRIQESAHVRWHKTGKTKPVMQNGVQKGCKKIMVLYETSTGGSKPGKCNWVMHQYHLGTDVEERDGEFVVSKIFFQTDKKEISEPVQVFPMTPKMDMPDSPRDETTPYSDYVQDDYFTRSNIKDAKNLIEGSHGSLLVNKLNYKHRWVGEPEAVDLAEPGFLHCNETIDSHATFVDIEPENVTLTQVGADDMTDVVNQLDGNAFYGIDLEDIEMDTPPDFQIGDLQFASQDSVFDLLDRI